VPQGYFVEVEDSVATLNELRERLDELAARVDALARAIDALPAPRSGRPRA
jgi:hypothetical protein